MLCHCSRRVLIWPALDALIERAYEMDGRLVEVDFRSWARELIYQDIRRARHGIIQNNDI